MPEMLRPMNHQQPPAPRAGQPLAKANGTANPPQVVVRGQIGEDQPGKPAPSPPATAKLVMPSPEELGLLTATATPQPATPPVADWAAASSRLDQLGACYYRLEKAPEGGFRFVCALPHPQQPNQQRQFEARAATDAEVIRLALQQVEEWKAGQKTR
jgi:hypothetical protein